MPERTLRGLYVITDSNLCGKYLLHKVEQALLGGARIVQYRDKQATTQQKQHLASQLATLCQHYQSIFIINDDIELAKTVNADGVHIGQQDGSLQKAREVLGDKKIIGISCNNRLEWALQAQQQGADYVAFGRFFPSLTKPHAPQADIALLRQARKQLDIPITAIGGIQAQHAQQLIDAGADMLAMIHAIFAQHNVRQSASQVATLFNA